MPVVQYARTAHVQQVDGIPATVLTGEKVAEGEALPTRPFKRSVEGALHFSPGGTLVLTQDEYDWLKVSRKSVFKSLLKLADDPAPGVEKTADEPKKSDDLLAKKSGQKPSDSGAEKSPSV